MVFCMTNTQSEKEREGKERKNRKAILDQTTLNHHTRATQRGRGHQDKSNNVNNSQLLPPEPATDVARRRLGH